jgi:hypothetical protein
MKSLLKVIKVIFFLWLWYCLGIGIADFLGMFIKDSPIYNEQETFVGTTTGTLAFFILIGIYFIYEKWAINRGIK